MEEDSVNRLGSFLPYDYPDSGPMDVMITPDPKWCELCAEYWAFSECEEGNITAKSVGSNIAKGKRHFLAHFAAVGWCLALQKWDPQLKELLTYTY